MLELSRVCLRNGTRELETISSLKQGTQAITGSRRGAPGPANIVLQNCGVCASKGIMQLFTSMSADI